MVETTGSRNELWIDVPRLQLRVTPMTATQVVRWIDESRATQQLLLNHNLHSAYLHLTDEGFRQLYDRADRVVIDGAPVLALLPRQRRRDFNADARIGSTDWIEALQTHAARSGRLFVYGATSESNDEAVRRLTRRLPDWRVGGVHGFTDSANAVRAINEFEPDLVLVGLGMPKQEHFLLEHWDQLPAAVYATVGGAIDYVAGRSKLAPRWIGRIGLEWLWRLVNDPARLANRYLVEPFRLARALRLSRIGKMRVEAADERA